MDTNSFSFRVAIQYDLILQVVSPMVVRKATPTGSKGSNMEGREVEWSLVHLGVGQQTSDISSG